MGWLDIFKSAKPVNDILDKDNGLITQFGGWIGNSNFTPEEVAELNAQTAQDVRKFVVDTMSESTDRSRTRRSMALLVMRCYILMLFLAGMVFPIDAEWTKVWIDIATSWTLGGLVTSISVFFYGSHALAKYQEDKK